MGLLSDNNIVAQLTTKLQVVLSKGKRSFITVAEFLKASLVTNDSSVIGSTVKDALETLKNSGSGGNTFQSGTFTLSVDGSTSHITTYDDAGDIIYDKGNTDLGYENQLKVKFQIAGNATTPQLNQTIVNETSGATGIITDIQIGMHYLITVGTLTTGSWTATDSVHYNTIPSIATPILSLPIYFILTIPTTKKLKLWQGLTKYNSYFSSGISDGIINQCNSINSALGTKFDLSNNINVNNNPNGWTGIISQKSDTSFDITLIQIGTGLSITSQFHLIEQ